MPKSLRIALLAYRGNPYSGGQGVYVHYLSKALTDLGHHVEVFAGPPYPVVDERVNLNEVPSLDLYRSDDPFRTPSRSEFRDWIDYLEFGVMCTAGFPEPLTFSLRAAREIRNRASEFDVVHDNQSLGYGLLGLARRIPIVATVHHPCTLDARLELAQAPNAKKKASLRRWYAFTRMQARVARRLPRIISVSEAAKADVVSEFRVEPHAVAVVHNGVDVDLFRPLPDMKQVPGRIVTTASADVPLKGLQFLIEAIAKLRTERDVHLVVVGKARKHGLAAQAIDRFGMGDAITFRNHIDRLELVKLYAEAEVAVVPSLYEGFSLPAIEAMSCGVPLVTTNAGALPEVVGTRGDAALLVPPKDAGALAAAIGKLLDDRALAGRLGAAGRRRAVARFSWKVAAGATAAEYERVIRAHG
jgi:glycosyltransferase involved in cell wall biosynthesis